MSSVSKRKLNNGLSQKLKNTVKTIFMNYLEFHNAKQDLIILTFKIIKVK